MVWGKKSSPPPPPPNALLCTQLPYLGGGGGHRTGLEGRTSTVMHVHGGVAKGGRV